MWQKHINLLVNVIKRTSLTPRCRIHWPALPEALSSRSLREIANCMLFPQSADHWLHFSGDLPVRQPVRSYVTASRVNGRSCGWRGVITTTCHANCRPPHIITDTARLTTVVLDIGKPSRENVNIVSFFLLYFCIKSIYKNLFNIQHSAL